MTKKAAVRAIRTLIHPEVNTGKVAKLEALFLEYMAYLRDSVAILIERRCWTMPHGELQVFFPRAERLTSHFEKCARHQAVNMVSSWVKSLYPNLMRAKIGDAGILTDDQRRQLYTIGKYTITKPCTTKHGPIDAEMVDLYWWCVWNEEVTGRRPKPRDTTPMVLSEKVVRLEPAGAGHGKDGRESKSFDLWLSMSTLEPRARVLLPLAPHPELPTKQALAANPKLLWELELATTISLFKDVKGRWVCQLVDRREHVDPVSTGRKVGIDMGLNVIAATSDGRLLGRGFKERFDVRHGEIRRVRRMRQQQGLDKDSPRLRMMESGLSGMVKTEVGRVVNLLLHLYPGFVFVIEQMSLRGVPGSKRFAYNAAINALLHKAIIEFVNNAYNSQECVRCHHVSRGNRSGTRFRCENCGYKSHADIVGAVNALGRSEDKSITLQTPFYVVRAMLRARYPERRFGVSAAGRDPPGVPYVRSEGNLSPRGPRGRRETPSGPGPLTRTARGSHSVSKLAAGMEYHQP